MLFHFMTIPSLAYLDPNTGSIITQGIVASVAVVGIVLKTFSSRIKALFGKKSEVEDDEE